MGPMPPRPRSRPLADFIEPCLPRPADKPPAGPDWLHEIKHDGPGVGAHEGAHVLVAVLAKEIQRPTQTNPITALRETICSH